MSPSDQDTGEEMATINQIRTAATASILAFVSLGMVVTVTGEAIASAATESKPSTIKGTLGDFEGGGGTAFCHQGQYIQRGANQSVPKTKEIVQTPIFGPKFVAWRTEPNEIGSRAVTSFLISFFNFAVFGGEQREWSVTYWCTTDKANAWLVFGIK
jgi:hypothetical protein